MKSVQDLQEILTEHGGEEHPQEDHLNSQSLTLDQTQLRTKRIADLVVATSLVVLFLPLMCLIAVVIKLDSAGPILFCQKRFGRHGKPFLMYKFRTMYADNNDESHRIAVQKWMAAKREGRTYKLENDPRITRIGGILRKTSLDELPQLINVYRGEMSLVGPRPALEYEYENYSDYHKKRLAVPPGITGLWQTSGWHQVSFEEMVRDDLNYIATWSLWRDIVIMIKTASVIISAKGS